jgi:hypothetical protein
LRAVHEIGEPASYFEGDPDALAVLAWRDVAEALAAGDRGAAYEAVRRGRGKAASAVEREAAERVLSTRRAFAVPVASPPSGSSLRGWGLHLSGVAERDVRTHTHVVTQYLRLAYVPAYPLGSYLVSELGPRGDRIVGRVPLRVGHRRMRWLVILVALGAIALAWWLLPSGRPATRARHG